MVQHGSFINLVPNFNSGYSKHTLATFVQVTQITPPECPFERRRDGRSHSQDILPGPPAFSQGNPWSYYSSRAHGIFISALSAFVSHGCRVQTWWPKVRPPSNFTTSPGARSEIRLHSFTHLFHSRFEDLLPRCTESWRPFFGILSFDVACGSIGRLCDIQPSGDRH